jgi:hypothetical protein
MKHLFGVVLITALLSSCATQSFDVNPPVAPMNQATLEESQPFFVYGVGQSSYIDAAEVCGGAANVARIETEQNALDSVLSFLTGGIYTPRTARVYCLSEPS